jgi:nucleosome binding factor SPN SPT16 subunit
MQKKIEDMAKVEKQKVISRKAKVKPVQKTKLTPSKAVKTLKTKKISKSKVAPNAPNASKVENKEINEPPKKVRNNKRNALIALVVFSAFISHLFLAKGSSDFFQRLMQGDMVTISNVVMLSIVFSGWFLVYKYLGKLL